MIRRILQVQGVGDHRLPDVQSGPHLDEVAFQRTAKRDLHAAEAASGPSGDEYVASIMKLKHCIGRDCNGGLWTRGDQGRGSKHADAQQKTRILHLDADLRGAQAGV